MPLVRLHKARGAWLAIIALCGGCVAADSQAVVDSGATPAACKRKPPTIASCLVGLSFIDCGFDGNPKIYCSCKRCYWVQHGCPVEGFDMTFPSDCKPSNPNCDSETRMVMSSFFYARGDGAWTRHRAMNLSVKIDPNQSSTTANIKCVGGDVSFTCNKPVKATRSLPGTLGIILGRYDADYIEVEVDVTTPTPVARVCRVPSTDLTLCRGASTYPTALCATGGEVVINAIPKSAAGLDRLRGQFSANFPDGTKMTGAF